MCWPLVVGDIEFAADVTSNGKFRFSHGFHGQTEGLSTAYAKCFAVDKNWNLIDKETEGPFVGGEGDPAMLISKSKNRWPEEIITDCRRWKGLSEAELDSNPDAAGACLWWIREYEELLSIIDDLDRMGVVRNDGIGPMYEQLANGRCDSVLDPYNNMMLCRNISFVQFEFNIPKRVVSGSEVIYGPVGLATQTIQGSGVTLFDGQKTKMQIYEDTEFIPAHTFQKVVESERLPQPSVFFVPNRGSYRFEVRASERSKRAVRTPAGGNHTAYSNAVLRAWL